MSDASMHGVSASAPASPNGTLEPGSEQTRLAFQLFYEIGILNQLATAEFNRMLPGDLHVSHFSIINHLVRRGDGKTPLALATAFQVSKANMTNTVARLLERGFIRLEPHRKDGRSKLVFLTDEGRSVRDRAIVAVEPMLERVAAEPSFRALIDALPALRQMREALDRARDEDVSREG